MEGNLLLKDMAYMMVERDDLVDWCSGIFLDGCLDELDLLQQLLWYCKWLALPSCAIVSQNGSLTKEDGQEE